MRLPFNGSYPITQKFGGWPERYAKYKLNGHNGIDFGVPTATPILAPHAGTVIEAMHDPGYGYYVKIENDKEGSVLAHLQEIHVRIGFQVSEGQVIGASDNTGDSTGPHLHFGYYTIPRNRQNGYNGFIDQESLLYPAYVYEYGIGEIIEPETEIPVGEAPGKERFEYGKIGPNFPAKITNIKDGYYNIDQTFIGGGTGWVKASSVDSSESFEPAISDVAPSASHTDEQYVEIQGKNQTLQNEVNKLKGILLGYQALGFEKSDDVTQLLLQKDETILGLNKQLQQVLERNRTLAKMVQDKEVEDSTAIDEGIRAMEELKEVKDAIVLISQKTETKPTVFEILEKIEEFKRQSKKFVNKVQEEIRDAEDRREKETGTKPSYGISWLMNIFGLKRKGGEVS